MPFLSPISDDVLALYDRSLDEGFEYLLDRLSVPRLSRILLKDLEKMLGSREGAKMVAFAVRFHQLHDEREHVEMRSTVLRLLKKDGVRLTRGKRTHPRLQELVEMIAPLLVYYGLPLSVAERSRLVRALQWIAIECDIPGDPRDELKRLRRIDRENRARFGRMVTDDLVKAFGSYIPPKES